MGCCSSKASEANVQAQDVAVVVRGETQEKIARCEAKVAELAAKKEAELAAAAKKAEQEAAAAAETGSFALDVYLRTVDPVLTTPL